ncbi:hypothetical protein EV189_2109 [Motilibacter rhizosphaerae]|uniref:Ig-like domain-containing protein n=1 Tax=Motilibacter rhizosphaerae TaxID=598652 RepID=A0A4Q7NTI1_9ACTN|nr:hypothetical protein [Motilibacter rhizosphaerae]RZS90324.1 hypothetical protein EV189_2109 [Motilibacter rhizosphaerae]
MAHHTIPTTRRRTAWPAVVVTAGAVAGGLAAPAASAYAGEASATTAAACDLTAYTPPTITSLGTGPAALDVRSGPKDVSLTVGASDDDRGVSSVQVLLASPKGPGGKQSYAYATLRRTAGTALSGTFSGKATVARWVVPGAWSVESVIATDAGGAVAFLQESDLAAKGWPHQVDVTSTPDLVPPAATALTIAPVRVDTTRAVGRVHVTAQVADGLSGVLSASVELTPPGSSEPTVTGLLRRTSGTARKGVFSGDVVVPRWVGKGAWRAQALLVDGALNTRTYATRDLAANHWTSRVAVVSGTDAVAPTLSGVTATPATVDTRGGTATFSVSATARDALSGVASARVTWTSPSGQSVTADLQRASGSAQVGRWTGTGTLSVCSEAGAWKPSATVRDVAGNERVVTAGLPVLTVLGRDLSAAATTPPAVGGDPGTPDAPDTSGTPAAGDPQPVWGGDNG